MKKYYFLFLLFCSFIIANKSFAYDFPPLDEGMDGYDFYCEYHSVNDNFLYSRWSTKPEVWSYNSQYLVPYGADIVQKIWSGTSWGSNISWQNEWPSNPIFANSLKCNFDSALMHDAYNNNYYDDVTAAYAQGDPISISLFDTTPPVDPPVEGSTEVLTALNSIDSKLNIIGFYLFLIIVFTPVYFICRWLFNLISDIALGW